MAAMLRNKVTDSCVVHALACFSLTEVNLIDSLIIL